MRAIKNTIVLLLTIMPCATSAQNPTVGISEPQIIEEALCTFEEYEVYGVVNGLESKENFLRLFVSKEAPVFNDLMGIAVGNEIKAAEYAQLQLDNIQSLEAKFANVRKERIYNDNGVWKIDLSADKSLSYFNSCNLYFSTTDWYGTSFRETFTMVYHPDDNYRKCKIEKISGTIASTKNFPERFYVFNNTSDHDYKLMYVNNEGQRLPLKFNTYGQVIINGDVGQDNFYFPNSDTKLNPIVDAKCRSVSMIYKPERWRLKLHYDQPIGFYSASTDNLYLKHTSSGMEVGLDIGYNVHANRKFKLGVYSGLGVSISELAITLDTLDYAYDTYGEADIDGDIYKRHYKGMSGKEKVQTSHLVLPLYLEGDIRLHNHVSAILQIGLRNYIKLSQSSSDISFAADKVYGYYPQYDLNLDHTWGFNNFVQEAKWNHSTDNVSLKTYGLDVFGNIGVRFKLIPRLFADILVGYQTTLVGGMDNIDSTPNFVTYSCSGTQGNDQVKSLLYGFDKMNRQHIKLSVALMWKF